MSGYRTYIAAAILAILTGLKAAGVIDAALFETLMALAAAFGLASLRAAVQKSGPPA